MAQLEDDGHLAAEEADDDRRPRAAPPRERAADDAQDDARGGDLAPEEAQGPAALDGGEVGVRSQISDFGSQSGDLPVGALRFAL